MPASSFRHLLQQHCGALGPTAAGGPDAAAATAQHMHTACLFAVLLAILRTSSPMTQALCQDTGCTSAPGGHRSQSTCPMCCPQTTCAGSARRWSSCRAARAGAHGSTGRGGKAVSGRQTPAGWHPSTHCVTMRATGVQLLLVNRALSTARHASPCTHALLLLHNDSPWQKGHKLESAPGQLLSCVAAANCICQQPKVHDGCIHQRSCLQRIR